MFKISKIEEEEGLRSHCGLSMPRHTIHSPYRVIQYHTILYYIERRHNYKSWVAFLQGFLPINPSGRVNRGPFSFWE